MRTIEKVCKDCGRPFDCPSTWRRTQRCPTCSKNEEHRKDNERKKARGNQERYGTCEKCGRTDWLFIHHVKPLSKGGTNQDGVIAVCYNCHETIHSTGWTKRL